MNAVTAKKTSLIAILNQLGVKKAKEYNKNAWYYSPFRNERTASFKVNKNANIYYDHGEGKGGNVLDFIMSYYNCDFKESLQIVKEKFNFFSFQQQSTNDNEKAKKYAIIKVTELSNPKLLDYIKDRKINIAFAQQFCKEVHYTFDQKKIYQGVGFKNDLDGFEIRYHKFKCCLLKKSITTILNHSETACFFESWSDFLSYLTLKKRIPKEDFIILNSTSLIKKTEALLQNYKILKVFFDNDTSGKLAFEHIQKQAPNKAIDCSVHYADFKDLNDYLISV